MNAALLTAYRTARAISPQITAIQAVAMAKATLARTTVELHEGRRGVHGEVLVDGFQCRIRITDDEYGDLSYMGTIDATDARGAIKILRPSWYDNGGHRRTRYAYYHPEETVADLRFWFITHKYGRSYAYEAAQRQVRSTMKMLVDLTLREVVVTILVYRKGVELGRQSLGGVSLDVHDSVLTEGYIQDVIQELLPEAVREAKDTLAALCQDVCKDVA